MPDNVSSADFCALLEAVHLCLLAVRSRLVLDDTTGDNLDQILLKLISIYCKHCKPAACEINEDPTKSPLD